jgi:hypothetical protein
VIDGWLGGWRDCGLRLDKTDRLANAGAAGAPEGAGGSNASVFD